MKKLFIARTDGTDLGRIRKRGSDGATQSHRLDGNVQGLRVELTLRRRAFTCNTRFQPPTVAFSPSQSHRFARKWLARPKECMTFRILRSYGATLPLKDNEFLSPPFPAVEELNSTHSLTPKPRRAHMRVKCCEAEGIQSESA